VCER
jgi:hypothetical protein